MIKRLKNLLIPHKGNGYRPDFLERISMGIMLVLVLLSFSIANLQALLWISSDWLVSTILPSVIVDLTNDKRDVENLMPLTRSDVLNRAATLKAKDMAEGGYFAHYSPTGVSPWHWFDEVGYDYLHAGENLAVHFTESGDVVDAWMNSPSHRANIMNGQYSEIGVGSARGEYKGQPTIFVVQLFGTTRKPQNELTQASGVSETVSSDVVIENVTSGATESTVAPATVSIVEATPSETSFETKVDETHSAIVSDSPMTLEDEGESSIVYTSLATTSREGEPVPVSEMAGSTSGNSVPLLTLRGATEPSLWLETFYAVLAFAVIVALMVSLMLEWKRHHPVQIAYAGGLLAVMALLLYIHTSLTSMVLIV